MGFYDCLTLSKNVGNKTIAEEADDDVWYTNFRPCLAHIIEGEKLKLL
jgi:hypothetical protein